MPVQMTQQDTHVENVERLTALARDMLGLSTGDLPILPALKNEQREEIKEDLDLVRTLLAGEINRPEINGPSKADKRATIAAEVASMKNKLYFKPFLPVYMLYLLHEDAWLAQLQARREVFGVPTPKLSTQFVDGLQRCEGWKQLVNPLVPGNENLSIKSLRHPALALQKKSLVRFHEDGAHSANPCILYRLV